MPFLALMHRAWCKDMSTLMPERMPWCIALNNRNTILLTCNG